jgi:hypothetical protein
MNTKRYFDRILLLTTILAILISSCDLNKIKIGEVRMMYGVNEDGHISYEFTTFTGYENGNIQAETGQTISFDYQAAVDKGSLVIEWQDPNGEVLWRKDIVESESGSEDIAIHSPGRYTIVIQGKGAGGNFDISWQTN